MAKARPPRFLALAFLAFLAACGEQATGPVQVSAIGGPPQRLNPNLRPLDPPSAFLLEATAQGLVRFDSNGEIEPALARSWIVSDDGRRYTFRIESAARPDGRTIDAEQVAARLRAALSRASRNPLKPVLGAIDNVVAMTDHVLEISLKAPRPYLLQLLAQPEMAILVDGAGTGPFRSGNEEAGIVRLTIPEPDEEEDETAPAVAEIRLRGEAAPTAVARFVAGGTDLVLGGEIGALPYARAGGVDAARLVFDPVAGLFGLAVAADEGPLQDPALRRALSMAVDRDSLAALLGAPLLQPRVTLLPALAEELPSPSLPDWAQSPLPMRREAAARAVAALGEPVRLRIALSRSPGHRLLFAQLRHDWRLVGVALERVEPGQPADLRLVDSVAPGVLASWYLRHFACDASPICDPAADEAMEAARTAASPAERRAHLATADQLLTALVPFIPLGSPVRWSLTTPRLTGFRPNAFAVHSAETLIAGEE